MTGQRTKAKWRRNEINIELKFRQKRKSDLIFGFVDQHIMHALNISCYADLVVIMGKLASYNKNGH